MLIPSGISLILFHQHGTGLPERHFRRLWAANRKQRCSVDSLEVLMAAARAVPEVFHPSSHGRSSFGYPSKEPSRGYLVSGWHSFTEKK